MIDAFRFSRLSRRRFTTDIRPSTLSDDSDSVTPYNTTRETPRRGGGGVVRVEADLPETTCDDHFNNKCITTKCLTSKMKVKVGEYDFCNYPIRW